ncbi:hypothetical protein GJAV_G00196000 [Gymnothorax javanicus]|nr:hypothetical protein GJAV_G00196000 [Gymnothorax javanicus]
MRKSPCMSKQCAGQRCVSSGLDEDRGGSFCGRLSGLVCSSYEESLELNCWRSDQIPDSPVDWMANPP